MRTILILLGNELRTFAHDKVAIALTFLVPIVLIYIFGNVFGVGRSGGSGPTGIPIAVVSATTAPASVAVAAALENEKAFKVLRTKKDGAGLEQRLSEAEVREMMRAGTLRYALIFPAEVEGAPAFGLQLKFLNNPRNEIESQTVLGLVQKTIYTSAPQALFASLQNLGQSVIGEASLQQFNQSIAESVAQAFGGDAGEIAKSMQSGNFDFLTAGGSNGGGSIFESLIKIENEEVKPANIRSPAATRAVGGWAMMFLLFSLTGAATSLFDEKKAGLFQRLLAAPVRRTHILWSKYLFGMLLGLVQLCSLFGAGHLLFGIDITSNFFNLVLVCLATSTACVAFGMLLASVSKSAAAASGLGTLLILTMSAVGGAWFPISFMPEFIQQLSKFTLVYWAIEGFLQVLWAGATTWELLPTLGILFGIAAVVNAFSVWRFQRGQIFE